MPRVLLLLPQCLHSIQQPACCSSLGADRARCLPNLPCLVRPPIIACGTAGGQPVRLGVTQYPYPVGAVVPGATSAGAADGGGGGSAPAGGEHPGGSGSQGAGVRPSQPQAGVAGGEQPAAAPAGGAVPTRPQHASAEQLIISPNGVAFMPPEVRRVCARVWGGGW